MLFNLSDQNTIANQYVAELRDVEMQKDRMRFRKNVERLGEIFAYEISKTLTFELTTKETPLGSVEIPLPTDRVVISSILRAGLPLHNAILNSFDQADNAFISAYRKHHKDGTFEISLEYVTCPNLDECVLIVADPMLATGSSFEGALKILEDYGKPRTVHIVCIIASAFGVNRLQRLYPEVNLWVGAIDEELTAKSFIVPGLGDAGDLLYGAKLQE